MAAKEIQFEDLEIKTNDNAIYYVFIENPCDSGLLSDIIGINYTKGSLSETYLKRIKSLKIFIDGL